MGAQRTGSLSSVTAAKKFAWRGDIGLVRNYQLNIKIFYVTWA